MIGGGPDALLDHELIKYLLALVIPRRDTKPLAHRLLAAFGGLGPLQSAYDESLARIGGLTENSVAALKFALAAALRLLKTEVEDRRVLGSWQALLDDLTADMAYRATERVRVLYFNSKNLLIRDEAISEGSVTRPRCTCGRSCAARSTAGRPP